MNPTVAEPPRSDGADRIRYVAADAVRAAAHLSHEARLLKSMAADAVEDGVHAAKRSYKIAVRRLEDATDQAAANIRKQPFKAVGVALGAGLLLGVAGAWLVRSRGSRIARRV